PISKSAVCGIVECVSIVESAGRSDSLRVWKPAIRQTWKSAVQTKLPIRELAPVSDSAGHERFERIGFCNDWRVWKPAIQQTWKSAVRMKLPLPQVPP